MVTHRFSSSDGIALCADVYEPAGESSIGKQPGLILIVHGYCEHRGRYHKTAAYLAERGYRVMALDLRGHGESGGARAHAGRFRDYLRDVDAALAQAKLTPEQRPVLLGHSMGGLVSLLYTLERPERVRLLSLSSPFLGLKLTVPWWKRKLGELSSIVYPGLALPSELDPGDLSHDPAIGPAYVADPLVSRIATARWFTEAMATQAEVLSRAQEVRLPVLLMHGGDDRIADPAASKRVFDRLGASDKTLTLYPGLFHEIFNEVERQRVLEDLASWLEAHPASAR